ncbi:MAG: flagellar basal body-associated FliL family protein [Peptococcaceae bacterium]|nr:flagellar basal body-associated FliL family protein [Peptococcaceae bacterium]
MPKNTSEETQEKTGKKNKPKKKNKLFILIIALLVLAGSSAGSYFFFFKKPAGEAAEQKKPKTVENESMDMGEMVVNLAGNGAGHYLRVKIVLEYPKDKKLAEELKKKKHQVSDVLITALRSKSFSEVTAAGATEQLKKSLVKEVNGRLEHGEITGIYFTDFLVQ